ncbi:MAG TPA: PKD domain-containing protein [Candidatus Hydrogenedentes bacterium]|nr:PKD domain-containing protein [Candidatus Hydrogenedentota bacterium]
MRVAKGANREFRATRVFACTVMGLFSLTAAGQNLLVNPSAERGDLSGWTILAAPAGGWRAGALPLAQMSSVPGRDPHSPDGCSVFFTDGSISSSNLNWCRRCQIVDLMASGYTEEQLDAAPDITVSEWFRGFSTRFIPIYSDTAYLNVELRGADGETVIGAPYHSGEFTTSGIWQQKTHTFSGYGPGVRYIYWEDGGKAAEQWGFTDGPVLDEAFLTVDLPFPTGPDIAVSTDLLDFGTFPRTGLWSDPQLIRIENTGTEDMDVNFCICAGAFYDFAFQNVPASAPIPPGGHLDLEVVFKPITIGPREATVRIFSNVPDAPTLEVTVLGFGAPVCSGITRVDASPTGAAMMRFRVKFSEAVFGVDATDFALVETGMSGSAITAVADVSFFDDGRLDEDAPSDGSGADWLVTVAVGTGQGTLGLNLLDDDSILSVLGGYPLGGEGAGNGDFAGGEIYQYLGAAQVFYVDGSAVGGGDGSPVKPFKTIAEAVANTVAGRGDFVSVRPGTYNERITLKQGVILESVRGAHRTHIAGGDAGQRVVTGADNTAIRGFTIRDAGAAAAVYVPASCECRVSNCVLANSYRGLLAGPSASVIFENNTVYLNTIQGLHGEAGAIFPVVYNNIFSSNNTAFAADSGSVADAGYNCFDANTVNFSGVAAAATDFTANPMFVDAAAWNFHLKAASPCRNGGSPLARYNDMDGTRNDLGADGGPGGVRDAVHPIAILDAAPVSGNAPLTVSFSGASSSDEWGIALYQWDFGAGGEAQTGAEMEYTYASAGAYTAILTVRDNSGLSSQATRQIHVNYPANEPPTASAGASPRAGAAPFQVQFTGTGSDPDGGPVSYAWTFGTGATSTAQNPAYTYPAGSRGSYKANLTVTDDEGVATQDSIYVTVTQETPDAAQVINPATETVVTVDKASSAIRGARVTLPAGAVAEPMVVALGRVPANSSPKAPAGAVSEVMEAGPLGLVFAQPVTLRIPLNAPALNPGQLVVAGYDEGAGYWSTEGLGNVQFAGGSPVSYVTAEASHFTFFVVLQPPSEVDINRDGRVDAVDVQLVINGALKLPLPPGLNTDVNGDGVTNAVDIQRVINAALRL